MKISKKYSDSIIFWSPFTYQVISSDIAHRIENYELLTKGKSDKTIKDVFKTFMFWFDCYSNGHISSICVYFLKSLFYADFMEWEVNK